MQLNRRIGTALGLTVAAVVLVVAGMAIGVRVASNSAGGSGSESRDFMFQVLGVKTANQGGATVNLFFHYRYTSGITERDIPNYLHLRNAALTYLATTDVSENPYWETLNQRLCTRLKTTFPLEAISCELQVPGDETPGPHEPGYRASIDTIGDITPLSIPGPPGVP